MCALLLNSVDSFNDLLRAANCKYENISTRWGKMFCGNC